MKSFFVGVGAVECELKDTLSIVMPWFHVKLLHTTRCIFLCNNCRRSDVMKNIHEAKMLQL